MYHPTSLLKDVHQPARKRWKETFLKTIPPEAFEREFFFQEELFQMNKLLLREG